MKASLTFDLPEDAEEYRLASQAGAMHAALSDFDNWLRGQIKYHADDVSTEELVVIDGVRAHFLAELEERGIVLD